MRARLKDDGSLSIGEVDGAIEIDEVAPHRPGDRLVIDPDNPRRAIVAPPPEPTYAERRAAEYPSTEAITVALWERIVEGRPEAADTLQALRAAVKARHPKPDAG